MCVCVYTVYGSVGMLTLCPMQVRQKHCDLINIPAVIENHFIFSTCLQNAHLL